MEGPKKDAKFGRARGLIAQKVEQVVPEWVKTNSDGYKSVETIGMGAVLITENDSLKKRLERLERR